MIGLMSKCNCALCMNYNPTSHTVPLLSQLFAVDQLEPGIGKLLHFICLCKAYVFLITSLVSSTMSNYAETITIFSCLSVITMDMFICFSSSQYSLSLTDQ